MRCVALAGALVIPYIKKDRHGVPVLWFYLCLPRKKNAKVPGPAWEPITAPT